ncbi:hypothetical protein Q2422_21130, partial [Escherichia coli]|nr:hypothetical protein [Escherichia coli]
QPQWTPGWFKLADPQTRNTFLQWAEKQPSS